MRHYPSLPDLNQRGSRANTNAGTGGRIVELRDREMAMWAFYEIVRTRWLAISVNGCVDASNQQPLPWSPPVRALVCGRHPAGPHQRHDQQQHTRRAMDHHRYVVGELARCQPTGTSNQDRTFAPGIVIR